VVNSWVRESKGCVHVCVCVRVCVERGEGGRMRAPGKVSAALITAALSLELETVSPSGQQQVL
jgi:hypothetical protein